MLESNQSEIGALALVARHIRILSRIREGLKQGLSQTEADSFSRSSPFLFNGVLKSGQTLV